LSLLLHQQGTFNGFNVSLGIFELHRIARFMKCMKQTGQKSQGVYLIYVDSNLCCVFGWSRNLFNAHLLWFLYENSTTMASIQCGDD